MSNTIYIPKVIGRIAQAAGAQLIDDGVLNHLYYDYGHYTEVCRQLSMKDLAIRTETRTKYPLVWLVMDFAETKGGKRFDLYCELNCQLIIATKTEQDWAMSKREEINYTPILYPIYYELLNQIYRSFEIETGTIDQIEHTKIDRPYWGGQEAGGSDKSLFNDVVDAIQIKNLKLKILKTC